MGPARAAPAGAAAAVTRCPSCQCPHCIHHMCSSSVAPGLHVCAVVVRLHSGGRASAGAPPHCSAGHPVIVGCGWVWVWVGVGCGWVCVCTRSRAHASLSPPATPATRLAGDEVADPRAVPPVRQLHRGRSRLRAHHAVPVGVMALRALCRPVYVTVRASDRCVVCGRGGGGGWGAGGFDYPFFVPHVRVAVCNRRASAVRP